MRLAYKALLPILVIVICLLGVLGVLYWQQSARQAALQDESRRLIAMMGSVNRLHEYQGAIQLTLLSYPVDRDPARLHAIVQRDRQIAEAAERYTALVADAQGRNLLESFIASRGAVGRARERFLQSVQANDAAIFRTAFDEWSRENEQMDRRLRDLNAFAGTRLQTTINDMLAQHAAFVRVSFSAALLAIAATLAHLAWLQRRLALRFGVLTAGTKQLTLDSARRRFNGHVLKRSDELGALARAFNEMADRLQAAHDSVRAEAGNRANMQVALERQVQLARLMECLARAANEAETPEGAMREMLVIICRYGGWDLARLGILTETRSGVTVERHFWHIAPGVRLERFIAASNGQRDFRPEGLFISAAVNGRRPVWLTDLGLAQPGRRLSIGYQEGLRTALAFPIVVHERVIAFLEFFSVEARASDEPFVQEIGAVGQQIALGIERSRALAEKERINAELEQRVATRTAELAASNKELESFAYSVSHDLRAPLRAIDGFSRLVVEKAGTGLAGEVRGYLERVRVNTQQMGQLMDDLLAFSRLGRQAVATGPVNNRNLVDQCLQQLQQEYEEKQVAVRFGALPDCAGDAALLKQVWVNLLSNAFKFTSQRSGACIEVGSITENGETVYFVRDNGVGFDMRYADKLFGVFQRLHTASAFPGTGVGLAIVQRIVHRHGGRVWAEAEPDKGATFHFTIGQGNRA